MPWVTPPTYTVGQLLTAALMNNISGDLTTLQDQMSHSVLSAQAVLEPGILNQIRAGRVLTLADFTTLLGLTAPVAGYNLSDLTDFSGNARSLTNKGAVTFGGGIMGAATEAAIFTGSTAQALYIADTGAADPFRIPYGSWGCWFKTAKLGANQDAVTKMDAAGSNGWLLGITSANVVRFLINGGTTVVGVTVVCDDRWHHVLATFDGSNTRIYVDGVLETNASAGITGPITYAGAYPLNIGGRSADGANPAVNPFFGRIDEAFVTQDVLTLEQVRMLYAVKQAHGAAFTPVGARLNVRRRRRGGALVIGNFSVTPKHLYNFTGGALTDAGSLNNALTNNNAALSSPGADGEQGGAFNFAKGASQFLSATDAGLPAGTTARSIGVWFKTLFSGLQGIVAWGTAGNYSELILNGSNLVTYQDVAGSVSSAAAYNDGVWHFAVLTADNAAADGLKEKLYVDGKLVNSVTTLGSITLAGAAAFVIGTQRLAPANYFTGQLDGVFVTDYAMTADEVASLYAVGAIALGASPKNPGDHVEGMDATNMYLIHDTLDSQHQVDLAVTA